MRHVFLAAILLLSLSLFSCTTLMNSEHPVVIDTYPRGAQLSLLDDDGYETPLPESPKILSLRRKPEFNLKVSWEDGSSQILHIDCAYSWSEGVFVNLPWLVFGPYGLAMSALYIGFDHLKQVPYECPKEIFVSRDRNIVRQTSVQCPKYAIVFGYTEREMFHPRRLTQYVSEHLEKNSECTTIAEYMDVFDALEEHGLAWRTRLTRGDLTRNRVNRLALRSGANRIVLVSKGGENSPQNLNLSIIDTYSLSVVERFTLSVSGTDVPYKTDEGLSRLASNFSFIFPNAVSTRLGNTVELWNMPQEEYRERSVSLLELSGISIERVDLKPSDVHWGTDLYSTGWMTISYEDTQRFDSNNVRVTSYAVNGGPTLRGLVYSPIGIFRLDLQAGTGYNHYVVKRKTHTFEFPLLLGFESGYTQVSDSGYYFQLFVGGKWNLNNEIYPERLTLSESVSAGIALGKRFGDPIQSYVLQ